MMVLLALVASVQPAPPRPTPRPPTTEATPIVPPSAPVIVASPERRHSQDGPTRSILDTRSFEIEVEAAGETLWRGTLLAGGQPASVSYEVSQASPECPSSSRLSSGFRLSINRRAASDQRDLLVNVRWSRSSPEPCDVPVAARVIEVTQAVAIGSDSRATVTGDGGLIVRLRRR